jgi:membrane-bound lytic murein transglycosylase D
MTMAKLRVRLLSAIVLVLSGPALIAQETEELSLDKLYETGKALFDQFAPEEIKEEYEFPSKAQWDEFAARLQGSLQGDNLGDLTAHEDEARVALQALRAFPGYEDYADWLQERIDYIEAAKELPPVASTTPSPVPAPAPKILTPAPTPTLPRAPAPKSLSASAEAFVPNYELWVKRMESRPLPGQAGKLMPALRAAFAAEGVPAELAWIAEAESTFNPSARSPVGAKGLFQFMPETAKSLGLSVFLPDERTDVKKSAEAAARYLRMLYGKFGDWPLALAAYNAGEGRVRRLLKQKNADTFAEIADSLPSETRMYVPKVCATIAVRAGVSPDQIAAPRAS